MTVIFFVLPDLGQPRLALIKKVITIIEIFTNVKYIKSSIDIKYNHKNYNIYISTQNAAILSFLIEENDQKSKC